MSQEVPLAEAITQLRAQLAEAMDEGKGLLAVSERTAGFVGHRCR